MSLNERVKNLKVLNLIFIAHIFHSTFSITYLRIPELNIAIAIVYVYINVLFNMSSLHVILIHSLKHVHMFTRLHYGLQ